MNARTGKIARLPEALREELNRRLAEGQLGPQILPWLNALPEVQAVLAYHFDGAAISAQNLSDWRGGGYRDWCQSRDRHHQRLEHTRELARLSMELAKAGGRNMSDGAAAILGGRLLEVLEGLEELRETLEADTSAPDPSRFREAAEQLDRLSLVIQRLRAGDHDRETLALKQIEQTQKAELLAIARAKFQRDTCELFLRWAEDQRAREIAAGAGDNADKIARLGQLMFGDDWAEQVRQE